MRAVQTAMEEKTRAKCEDGHSAQAAQSMEKPGHSWATAKVGW